MILVFDFRFGEGCFVGNRPVNGLLAAVDQVGIYERCEGAENLCFVGRMFSFVLSIPVSQYAEASELAALDIDPMLGKCIASVA